MTLASNLIFRSESAHAKVVGYVSTGNFGIGLRVLIAAAMSVLVAASSLAAETPNVLLILTDDQGFGDLSINGNPYLKTPNIDSIAKQGAQFKHFYVSTYCAPTRAALLTGRYPLRCGVFGVSLCKEVMKTEEVTLAETLRSAGYRTGCFGKWHNGEQYPYTPVAQGFDEFFGFCAGHTNNYFNATLLRDHTLVSTTGFITDVITDEAIKFIKKNRDKPFFCYVPYNAPHAPYQVPDKYYDKFAQKGFGPEVSAFYGMCENLDDNIGRLLNSLKELGIDDNTILIFFTDNGGTTGVPIYNAGMRDGKTSPHEGGSRVPLYIRWPARITHPFDVTQLAAHIDLYPTILDLCGIPLPKDQPQLDGVSLKPLIENPEAKWSERTLFTHNGISESNRYPGAVRTDRYRLVKDIPEPRGGSSAVDNDANSTPWELYDMQQDPSETKNIAADHPNTVAQLSKEYEEWLTSIRPKELGRPPIPVGYDVENPVTLSAHQSYHEGEVRFSSGGGYAHDYLTNWRSDKDKIWFDVEIVRGGEFSANLLYGCKEVDEGSVIALSTGGAVLKAKVSAADAPFISLPHRDEAGHRTLTLRKWAKLPMGHFNVDRGSVTLVLSADSIPRDGVMDFKGIVLQRVH
jgi:arylsulfatase A-like enzyme